jgi:uncharacterized protein YggE
MRRIHFAVPMLILMVTTTAIAADEQPRTISTSGEATVYVPPDEVVVTVGVQTQDVSLDKAKEKSDEQSAKLLKAVQGAGVEKKQIQTQAMEVTIKYKQNEQMDVAGYYVRRQYAILLKDPKKLEELVSLALKNGANQMSGVEYRSTEVRKHRDKAQAMALKAAKEKAKDMAEALDCDLGKPRTIGEGSWGYYYCDPGARIGGNSAQPASGGEEGGETMPVGQMGIRATVSVTFDLLTK